MVRKAFSNTRAVTPPIEVNRCFRRRSYPVRSVPVAVYFMSPVSLSNISDTQYAYGRRALEYCTVHCPIYSIKHPHLSDVANSLESRIKSRSSLIHFNGGTADVEVGDEQRLHNLRKPTVLTPIRFSISDFIYLNGILAVGRMAIVLFLVKIPFKKNAT